VDSAAFRPIAWEDEMIAQTGHAAKGDDRLSLKRGTRHSNQGLLIIRLLPLPMRPSIEGRVEIFIEEVSGLMAAAVLVNVTKSFRSFLCKISLGLARCLLNPTRLQIIPIPEETEDEALDEDMEPVVLAYCTCVRS
jgi:hypothetical protein